MKDGDDREFQAMQTVYSALASLDEDARSRVLDYVLRRLGLPAPHEASSRATEPPTPDSASATIADGGIIDIRSLRTHKAPRNAVEMAALVAYYLAARAPEADRKDTIGASDLQKYFGQAGFRSRSSPRMTLHQAKNAGYLDQAKRGHYRLNPVGFNLIDRGLPAAGPESPGASIGGRVAPRQKGRASKRGRRATKATVARQR